MKRWRILVPVMLLVTAFVFSSWAYMHRQNPMLVHLFADSSCACSDYDEETSGLTVLNPFRDRTPEASANAFFEDLKQGHCPAAAFVLSASECAFLMEHRRVSEWKLVNRQDKANQVSLYYKLTEFGSDRQYRFTGIGFIEVVKSNGNWKVSADDAQF